MCRRHSVLNVTVLCLAFAAAAGCQTSPRLDAVPNTASSTPIPLGLPRQPGSLKFAVLGDFGNASQRQFDTAAQFARSHQAFPFELVITTGDNLYGSERPQDYVRKFEQPYKPLLDAGVKFYASLGNHDSREQRNYKLFNMNGESYYTFKPPQHSVRFFALESDYMDPEQVQWLEKELKSSESDWKIVFLHHPLYSSGRTHGSNLELRTVLEPLFIRYNVSVVFQAHDHVYERIKPQHDITYWVVGSGGRFRRGDLDDSSSMMAKGFDTDNAFLLGEIIEDRLHFSAVSRTGQVVDSGTVMRRGVPE